MTPPYNESQISIISTGEAKLVLPKLPPHLKKWVRDMVIKTRYALKFTFDKGTYPSGLIYYFEYNRLPYFKRVFKGDGSYSTYTEKNIPVFDFTVPNSNPEFKIRFAMRTDSPKVSIVDFFYDGKQITHKNLRTIFP